MTFEEFKANLDEIRKYHKKLTKYQLSWFNVLLSQEFKRRFNSYIPLPSIRDKKHELNRRKRKAEAGKLPDELTAFEMEIASIIQARIYTVDDEDWKNDTFTVSESGEITYHAESDIVWGRSKIFKDTEHEKTFNILYDYYFNGYEVKHIAEIYNYAEGNNRDGVYYQIDKGVNELYQIYKERSNENEGL